MIGLTFIGDIFPGDELFTKGYGIKSKTDESHICLWTKNIRDVVGETNYIIGNLEGPLIEEANAMDATFYGKPAFAEVLEKSGINILNVANNHILEHGVEGFIHTQKTLQAQQLQTIGEIADGTPKILIIQDEETKICMAGFCDERVCVKNNPNCYSSLDEKQICDTLERMKALHPDVIVFVFHWGNEYIHVPSLEQRHLAYKLIDAGVHLIVGHHPHVIQPYEQYKNGHIIYSLGNFCFDDVQSDHFSKGMIARVSIQEQVINNISFEGVIVQDQAYTDDIVRSMDSLKFDSYFSQINRKYNQLKLLPDNEYQANYKKEHHHSHTKERIFMRLSLIKKMMDIHHRHKMQLLENFKNYLAH